MKIKINEKDEQNLFQQIVELLYNALFYVFLTLLSENFFVEFKEERRRVRKNLRTVQQALYIVRIERCKRKLQGRDIENKRSLAQMV